jgi:hypothetical protein
MNAGSKVFRPNLQCVGMVAVRIDLSNRDFLDTLDGTRRIRLLMK